MCGYVKLLPLLYRSFQFNACMAAFLFLIPWSFILIVWFCDSLLLCSVLETVVLVLIESLGCTLCQVEVLCLIFALFEKLASLTAPSAFIGNHNQ